jgi:asparagine synthase (glutamine-hydrolysing)
MDGHATFGHRRLSIIDIEGGAQPMLNEDATIAVVFNGAIYNFAELKARLAAKGHSFRTRSDTEVLVHGFEEWGEQLVQQLRGMFAFVIHDAKRLKTLAVRDRLGVKPFYYHHDRDSGRFAFASEIKALFAVEGVPRMVNSEAVPEYLAFRSVAGSRTMFRDIYELEPGCFLRIEDGQVRKVRYWSAETSPAAVEPTGIDERGADLLRDAVEARLVSDVPLGTITSGGLDSSVISAIAAKVLEKRIDTFCVGFADPQLDERVYARRVATLVGSKHHELVVEPHDILSELDRLTWAHDEPLTHPNAIPMHLLFRTAKEREGVTVLLSGEGADEVFGGYSWYGTALYWHKLRSLSWLAPLAARIPISKALTFSRILSPNYLLEAQSFSRFDQLARYGFDVRAVLETRQGLWPNEKRGLDGLFIYDQRAYLPPLLQRQDRMSMATGVEARVPFLDHYLVEWANSLPWQVKLLNGETKGLLKEISQKWLPVDIVTRRKVGFTLPLAKWLKPGAEFDAALERLGSPMALTLDVIGRRNLVDLVSSAKRKDGIQADTLWSIIAMDVWAERFLGAEVCPTGLPGARKPPYLMVASTGQATI